MPKEELPSLTRRQQEILEFVTKKIVDRGYGPTVREIGSQFGIRSPNGVMCHLKALDKKGYIRRTAQVSRGIELVDSPVENLRKYAKTLLTAWRRGDLVAKNKKVKDKLAGVFDDVKGLV